jgi:two-component system, chemotaxis family, chemotaxis protein CheV
MSTIDDHDILLDSGTNEVEIAEFIIGNRSFGTNVAKIREFVPFVKESVTRIPDSPESVEGVFILRDHTIPVINLKTHLKIGSSKPGENIHSADRPVVIITEFNDLINSFIADSINQIHRLSWDDLDPVDPLIVKYGANITGSFHVGDREILILDLENIIGKIFPEHIEKLKNYDHDEPQKHQAGLLQKRDEAKIVIVDDSSMIRDYIHQALVKEGYNSVSTFTNGKEALDYIINLNERAKKLNVPISNFITILLSDIEMPKMDGLTLCHKIKHELNLKNLPIVMFSSLINDQMAEKCIQVGADNYISKPKMDDVVKWFDNLLFAH